MAKQILIDEILFTNLYGYFVAGLKTKSEFGEVELTPQEQKIIAMLEEKADKIYARYQYKERFLVNDKDSAVTALCKSKTISKETKSQEDDTNGNKNN